MINVFILIGFLFLISLGYAGFVFAPWVPTRKKDAQRIIALVQKYGQLENGDVYELGAGTGIITIELARALNKKVIGIEFVFPLYFYAKIKAVIKKSKAVFLWKDFFKQDLSHASVIYLFGTPKPLAGKLQKKFEKECKEGALIISYVFAIKDWEPIEVSKPTENDLSIYVYKMKAARDLRGHRAA